MKILLKSGIFCFHKLRPHFTTNSFVKKCKSLNARVYKILFLRI